LVGFVVLVLGSPVRAQTDPALKTAVVELLESYLRTGPSSSELSDGSAEANWAVLKGVGIPGFQQQDGLRKGTWDVLLSPIVNAVSDSKFETLGPLQVLALWEETESDPERFVRLLGRDGLLNPKKPDERKRGKDLREAISQARLGLANIHSNAHFEKGGWKYTATASLSPSERMVRVAIRGSQPCKITGSARSVNLNLKGRLFEDPTSPSKIKVQVIDQQFQSQGCELTLKDRIDSVVRLSGGGEAKLSGNLDLRVRDEAVTGRFQIDLVSKQAGVALLTGRAVYTLRGKIAQDGTISVDLIPVSTSGSRVVRQMLEVEGTLVGTLAKSVGSGRIELPAFKDPLNWHDSRDKVKTRSLKR